MVTLKRGDLIHILCNISLHLKQKKSREEEDFKGLECFYWLSGFLVSHPVPGLQENIFTIYTILVYTEIYKKDTRGKKGFCWSYAGVAF